MQNYEINEHLDNLNGIAFGTIKYCFNKCYNIDDLSEYKKCYKICDSFQVKKEEISQPYLLQLENILIGNANHVIKDTSSNDKSYKDKYTFPDYYYKTNPEIRTPGHIKAASAGSIFSRNQ